MTMRCRGFRFGAAAAGIKSDDALDIGAIACERPAAAAAVFTRNRVRAAPVELSRAALETSGGRARAIVVNSGNANACTGARGRADARRMRQLAAETLGAEPAETLVASTGVIGVPLPMDRVETGLTAALRGARADRFDDFSRAILTTDRGPKVARRRLRLGGEQVTLLGCTKGAGMIAPDMATTLSFVVTDADLPPAKLHAALSTATDATYNAITVDGDTSTNDMIGVMAGGSGPRLRSARDLRAFGTALTELLDELAHALIRDGEGVHHVVTVEVAGARSERSARRVARAIAVSPLVKTAIAGGDPNWGRILCAAGNAGVALAPGRLALSIGDVRVVHAGVGIDEPDVEARAAAVMRRQAYPIRLQLGQGDGEARYLTCDLSHEYVSINADYRT